MRGNNRQNIFSTAEDMYHLMRIINHAHEEFRFSLIAFCIMTNHYHLLIRSEDDLSKIMRQINRKYSDYYSKRYHHVGRIYQQRYFAKVVADREGLLKVSRYIHRNPLETKVPMVNQLIDYPFSSFPFYTSQQTDGMPCLNLKILPELLPSTFAKTTAGYVAYCLEEEVESEEKRRCFIE